jgi:glycerol-3-phosphate acyltransferase PlsY
MAFVVVKWRYGVDIRQYGSGQVGGSNVFRNFSKPLGIAVGLYDSGKGILMVWLAGLLGNALGADASVEIAMKTAAGIATIIGHNWPVFLRFNAGRGLATSTGVALLLLPLGCPGMLFCALFTIIIGGSPLPLLLAVATLPLTSWALQEPLVLTLGLAVIFLLMVIRRLTAPRTARSKPVSTRELYINRLLFDRDIRDGDAWMSHKPEAKNRIKEEIKS